MVSEKLTIILADDSKVILKAFSRIMSEHYNLIEVSDGQSAWEEIEATEDICAVFSDWEMPRMNGIELAKKIRGSKNPRINALPIIMVTSKNEDDETKQEAFEAGVTDFVTKPFDRTELLARAKAHVKPLNVGAPEEEAGKAVLDTSSRIGNTEYFQQQANQMLSFSERHGVPVGFMLIGIDHMADIKASANPSPAQEREFLLTVGGYIAEVLRQDDSIAHLTNGIFGVLLSSAELDTAAALGARILNSVREVEFSLNGNKVKVNLSLGMECSYPADPKTLPVLFKNTREHLINALREGNSIYPKPKETVGLTCLGSLDKALACITDGTTDNIDWAYTLRRMAPLLKYLDGELGTELINAANKVLD